MEGAWQICLILDFSKMDDLYFKYKIIRELEDKVKRSAEECFRQNKSFWIVITM